MIRENLIFLNKEVNTRNKAIEVIINQADDMGLLLDKAEFLNSVNEREMVLPTSVGFKVAMPHGRSCGVKEAFVAFMKTKNEFIWDDRNNNEVDLVFLIAVPEENKNNLHLRFLSEISKRLMDEKFRNDLRIASNEHDIFKLLNEINEQVMEDRK